MKKMFIWLWLFTKRLYKKPTFLVLLALIPLLVLGYSTVARQDSGVVSIALASYDNEDRLTNAIMDDLGESKLISFHRCDTPEKAMQLLETGRVDAAWIFPAKLVDKFCKFINSPFNPSFIKVVERQSTIPLKLAREKLSGAVFAHCTPQLYLNYIRREIPQLKNVADEELLKHYEAIKVDGRLFEFSFMDGTNADELLEKSSYMTAPVRGLLAVVVVLCGLAGAMYAMQDEKRGTFAWLPERKRPFAELAGELICTANASVAMVIALALFGVTEHWLREAVNLLLFILAVCAFSMLVSRLCVSLRVLCTAAPVLLVTMIAICPVLFDLGQFYQLQLLFPPTYYINAVYSNQYLLWMAFYALICFALCFGIDKLRKKL